MPEMPDARPAVLDPPAPKPLTDAIFRRRKVLYAVVIVLFLLAFNGQWKVGRDSALFRGLARSLAAGQGYQFTAFASSTVYPGYPLILAGLERTFGASAFPPLALNYGLALLTLLVTYRLIALHYAQWVAVVITVGVGINAWFLGLSNELLTDLPFMLAGLLALYGWERIRLGPVRRDRVLGGVLLLVGLLAAASLRPTFWVLALSMVLVCIWGVIRGPGRRYYAAALAAVFLAGIVLLAADPRTRGIDPLAGGYERAMISRLHKLSAVAGENAWDMLTRNLSGSFFGGRFGLSVTIPLTMVLIASSLMLWRRHPLWTIYILLTVMVTIVMTSVPRYYTPVLPLLLLSWLLLVLEVARRLPERWAGVPVLVGVLLVVIPNLARSTREIANQRYRNVGGRVTWGDEIAMADWIREVVPPDARVLAPTGAPIMAYFSGRDVLSYTELLPRGDDKDPRTYPQHLVDARVRYAIFPSRLYDGGHGIVKELMDKGVIIPVERIGRVEAADRSSLILARVEINATEWDWRRNEPTELADAEVLRQPTPRDRQERLERDERRAAAEAKARKQAWAERDQRLERHVRKVKKLRKAQRAATQAVSATAPASQPAPLGGLLSTPAP
jgi:hypothetical protein